MKYNKYNCNFSPKIEKTVGFYEMKGFVILYNDLLAQ